MIARTGWGEESVIAEMKINEYNFLNHQHHDAGAFQLYYKGPLAIDAGTYQGSSGGYNSPHNKNFFKRTVAHNSLLIYDPDEKFPALGYGGADKSDFVTNDGGQRLPNNWRPAATLEELLSGDFKTGEVLAKSFGPDSIIPDYSHLKGDITLAYSSKVKEVKRSFVFLNLKQADMPAAFVVFDKIVSASAGFKKTWLLHSIEEPQITGNQVTISRTKDGDSGMLVNTMLLPEKNNAELTAVGGKGKEFWVSGINYPNEPKKGQDEANERGAWRVEISPVSPATEDYFLNVMQVTDAGNKKVCDVKRIGNDRVVGVQLADRVVTFSRDMSLITGDYNLKIAGKKTFSFVITDMEQGTWQVLKNGKKHIDSIQVSKGEHVLYFTGKKGTYRFVRLK
jgi:heparin/heparan-sulfate lyase